MLTWRVMFCDDVLVTDDSSPSMTVEKIVGRRVAKLREAKDMSQAELGQLLGDYLGKPWQRQAVWSAEQGKRALTAAELFALSYILRTPIGELFRPPPEVESFELPNGATMQRLEYADATPADDLDAEARSDLREALAEAVRSSTTASRATAKAQRLVEAARSILDSLDESS